MKLLLVYNYLCIHVFLCLGQENQTKDGRYDYERCYKERFERRCQ